MVVQDASWADQIAEVSTQAQFQTATVRVFTAATDPVYDIETGTWTNNEPTVLYEGQARVMPIRSNALASQDNPSNIVNVRFQLPYQGIAEHIPNDATVWVTSAPRNPALETLEFVVKTDLQGSSAAARTFMTVTDVEVSRV